MNLEDKLYILFEEPGKSRLSFILNTFIYILIIISIVNLMLYSVPVIQNNYGDILEVVRNIIMPIFVLEYIFRLYASGSLDKYKGITGKFKYAVTPYAIIDLLSILPYLLVNTGFNSSFIRSLRLLRIFRLFRVKKYAIFVQLMKKILGNIKEELIVLLFYTVVMIIILSFIIFEVEHEVQPEVFSNVFQTMWWAVATLTTVGYGDMYPITAAGKVITTAITIIGIGFVAIPGGLFASEFISALAEGKEKKKKSIDIDSEVCPHCGSKDLEFFSNIVLHNKEIEKQCDQINFCKECEVVWGGVNIPNLTI